MNTVENLMTRKPGTFSYVEQMDLKRLGPHRPKLELQQPTKDRGKQYTRRFAIDWYEKKKWLCGSQTKSALFCFPCLIYGGDAAWTRIGVTDLKHLSEKIRKHESGAPHMDAALQLALLGQPQRLGGGGGGDSDPPYATLEHNREVEHNRGALARLTDLIRFCGAFDIPVRDTGEGGGGGGLEEPGASPRRQDMLEILDRSITSHMYIDPIHGTSREAIREEVLACMLEVCQDRIRDDVRAGEFASFRIDTVAITTFHCHVAIVCRYMLSNCATERFWNVVVASHGSSVAEAAVAELDRLLGDAGIKMVIAVSCDGMAVTLGIPDRIRDRYPHAHLVCAHPLNTVVENVLSEVPEVRIFLANLSAFPAFFAKAAPTTALNRTPVPTPRDSVVTVTNLVHENQEDLVQCLEVLQRSRESDRTTVREASWLLLLLDDPTFLFYLALFQELLPYVNSLNERLRSADLDPVQVERAVDDFELGALRIRNALPVNGMQTLGEDSRQATADTESPDDMYSVARRICDAASSQVKQQLAFMSHMKAARLFRGDLFESYASCFPERELEAVTSSYPMLDRPKLRAELKVVFNEPSFRGAGGAAQLLHTFVSSELASTFSETARLLRILAVTPRTAGDPGSHQSLVVPRVKSVIKNCRSLEHLSAFAMLSVEGSIIDDMRDFNEKVVDKFAQRNTNRSEFVYK